MEKVSPKSQLVCIWSVAIISVRPSFIFAAYFHNDPPRGKYPDRTFLRYTYLSFVSHIMLSFKLLLLRRSLSKHSKITDIQSLLIPSVRPSALDVQFVDYDGVRFHLSTPERKTTLLLSMNIRCWAELVQYGANDVLRREYGSLMKDQAEPE